MQQQEHDNNSELCVNGCGFFGAQGTGGLCSVCWKSSLSERQAASQPSSVPAMSIPAEVESKSPVSTIFPSSSDERNVATSTELQVEDRIVISSKSVVSDDSQEKNEAALKPQKNKKRCLQCNKKVGLTGIECRCGYIFCGIHRYADQHNCSFDYKAAERAELARRNPGGGAFDKLEKL